MSWVCGGSYFGCYGCYCYVELFGRSTFFIKFFLIIRWSWKRKASRNKTQSTMRVSQHILFVNVYRIEATSCVVGKQISKDIVWETAIERWSISALLWLPESEQNQDIQGLHRIVVRARKFRENVSWSYLWPYTSWERKQGQKGKLKNCNWLC